MPVEEEKQKGVNVVLKDVQTRRRRTGRDVDESFCDRPLNRATFALHRVLTAQCRRSISAQSLLILCPTD